MSHVALTHFVSSVLTSKRSNLQELYKIQAVFHQFACHPLCRGHANLLCSVTLLVPALTRQALR